MRTSQETRTTVQGFNSHVARHRRTRQLSSIALPMPSSEETNMFARSPLLSSEDHTEVHNMLNDYKESFQEFMQFAVDL